MHTTRQDAILDFWFGGEQDDAAVASAQSWLWWSKDAATDAEIRRRFEPAVQAAARGDLDDWVDTPRHRLALVLLCDQFPRNIYRDTPGAFAFDERARRLCRQALAAQEDAQLRPIERVFLYLPLEHSEDPGDQDEAVRLFEALVEAVPVARRAPFEGFLDFARRHRDVIRRFGRFPHRNRILQRPSTEEESEFLKQKGSSF